MLSLKTDIILGTYSKKLAKQFGNKKIILLMALKATAKKRRTWILSRIRIRTRIKISRIRNTGTLYKEIIGRMLFLSIYLSLNEKPTFSISSFLVSAMPAGNMAFMYILDWSSPADCSPGLEKNRVFGGVFGVFGVF
jgi:hypothetical protein